MRLVTVLCAAGVAVGATAAVTNAFAAEDDFRYFLQLESGSFIPESGDYQAALEFFQRSGTDKVHVLVQLDQVPAAIDRSGLALRGLELQGYLPERSYYALASTALSAEDLAGLGVRWIAPIPSEAKIASRLLTEEVDEWAVYGGGLRIVAVQFHRDISVERANDVVAGFTSALGDWIEPLQTQILAIDPSLLQTIAERDEVKFIAALPPPLTGVNNSVRSAMQIDALHVAPYGLTGQGSNVLVYDVGLVDRNHPDFTGRVTWGESGSIANHSTHCAGTVGGTGQNSGGTYKGMAPATKITSYLYEACSPACLYNSPQDILDNYGEGLNVHGAQLSTNSLGSNIAGNGYSCSWEGDYELTAQLLDVIARDAFDRPFLSLWAAGNERANGRCGTAYNTTGVPATAKSPIVVGATMSNDHSMTWFSSWGPVDDGRLRPDVCAPGCQSGQDNGVTSTTPGGNYGSSCGTSMATPAVAGVIALLLEQGRRTFGFPAIPFPSTIKAMVVNTAQDYGNVGPDFQFGYGEVRGPALVDHLRNDYFYKEAQADQGERRTYEIDVDGLSVLKATLAWDDVPGEQLAAKELVNDLDLTLESPSGAIFDSWVLNPADPAAPATVGKDRRNPLEQVLVNGPENGTWKVHVDGFLVPEGPQTFSVVANTGQGAPTDVPEVSDAATLDALSSYPNPFLPSTTLRFRTDGSSPIDVEVFDTSGRSVRILASNDVRPAGIHFVTWDGRDDSGARLPAGMYFYQVRTAGMTETRKTLMLD